MRTFTLTSYNGLSTTSISSTWCQLKESINESIVKLIEKTTFYKVVSQIVINIIILAKRY